MVESNRRKFIYATQSVKINKETNFLTINLNWGAIKEDMILSMIKYLPAINELTDEVVNLWQQGLEARTFTESITSSLLNFLCTHPLHLQHKTAYSR